MRIFFHILKLWGVILPHIIIMGSKLLKFISYRQEKKYMHVIIHFMIFTNTFSYGANTYEQNSKTVATIAALKYFTFRFQKPNDGYKELLKEEYMIFEKV